MSRHEYVRISPTVTLRRDMVKDIWFPSGLRGARYPVVIRTDGHVERADWDCLRAAGLKVL